MKIVVLLSLLSLTSCAVVGEGRRRCERPSVKRAADTAVMCGGNKYQSQCDEIIYSITCSVDEW
jgi:hypothetical protein